MARSFRSEGGAREGIVNRRQRSERRRQDRFQSLLTSFSSVKAVARQVHFALQGRRVKNRTPNIESRNPNAEDAEERKVSQSLLRSFVAGCSRPSPEPSLLDDVQPFVSYGTKDCHQVENKILTKTNIYAMMDLLALEISRVPRSSRLNSFVPVHHRSTSPRQGTRRTEENFQHRIGFIPPACNRRREW
jgi:hypothetical protein